MADYVISDLHFGDAKVLEEDNRPFKSIEEMDEYIIKQWNSVVKENDTVYVAGDIGKYTHSDMKDIISHLNGDKILILSNEDDRRTEAYWKEIGFMYAVNEYADFSRYSMITSESYGVIITHAPPINQEEGNIYFYGMVHDSEMYQNMTKRSCCVCASRYDYKPINFVDALYEMDLLRAYKELEEDAECLSSLENSTQR